jgi:hypothetical protein
MTAQTESPASRAKARLMNTPEAEEMYRVVTDMTDAAEQLKAFTEKHPLGTCPCKVCRYLRTRSDLPNGLLQLLHGLAVVSTETLHSIESIRRDYIGSGTEHRFVEKALRDAG